MRLKIWNMCHWYGFLYALLPYGLLSTEVPFIYLFLFVYRAFSSFLLKTEQHLVLGFTNGTCLTELLKDPCSIFLQHIKLVKLYFNAH